MIFESASKLALMRLQTDASSEKDHRPMDETSKPSIPASRRISSGPLRIYEEEGKLFVTGFGLWIPVQDKEEGHALIQELEDQGYRICY